jgi:adenine/guanine phosphoribosyltransferase-like PRPP-binding protein
MPIDQGTIDAYNRAVTAYNQATLNLYIMLGIDATTTVITSGLAFAVLAASSMGAVYAWENARSDMYAARGMMNPYMVC